MNQPTPHRDADAKQPPSSDKTVVHPPQATVSALPVRRDAADAPPPQDTQNSPDAGNAGLRWLRARNAARDAWRRVDG